MSKIKLVMLVVLAVIFAGCKQNLKEDNVKKGVQEMFASLQKNDIEKTLSQYAEGYDKMSEVEKKKLREAFIGKEFEIVKIENDKVTAKVTASPVDGGQIIVKTVIFHVIEVDGKIRVKDIINVIENDGKTPSSGPNENLLSDTENDLDSPLSEEHD